MHFNPHPLSVGLLLSLTTLTAEASLTSYTGAGGAGLVYSSVSNLTWTQDANLFKTLYDANNNLVNLITAVTPSYTSRGRQVVIGDGPVFDDSGNILDVDDFDTSDGRLTWWGANAFTNYLNSISYAGSNQWRLPTSNEDAAGSEFGQLSYKELGGTATNNNIPNSAYFTNRQRTYWVSTESAWPAWDFGASFSDHVARYFDVDRVQFSAWAVSPGQVSAVPVPVPGAVWLFGTGLVGLLGLKRRGHAG